jgi:hypothetical protein
MRTSALLSDFSICLRPIQELGKIGDAVGVAAGRESFVAPKEVR